MSDFRSLLLLSIKLVTHNNFHDTTSLRESSFRRNQMTSIKLYVLQEALVQIFIYLLITEIQLAPISEFSVARLAK